MGGYTVLPAAQQQPNPGEVAMASLVKGLFDTIEEKKKKKLVDEAVKQHDLVPEIEVDSEGNQKITYKKRQAKEWKPATMDEAVAFEKAKSSEKEPKYNAQSKQKEESIRMKIANGEPLSAQDAEYYNKFLIAPAMRDTINVNDLKAKENAYNPSGVTNWGDVPFMRRVLGAITPSSTPEEKNLGALRPGGIFAPPQAQGPVVPSMLQAPSGNPAMPAPAPAPAAQASPYPEYPDAFQEGGVWKVMRNGQKFRIEE